MRSPVLATVAASAALLVLAGALARAQQPAGKAAPAGKTEAPLDKRAFGNVSDLRKAFTKEREKADRELKEKELAALKTYLKGKPADKDKALAAAAAVASDLEHWADAKAFGEQFLAEFGTSDRATEIKLSVAAALSNMDKAAEAKKLYLEVADASEDRNDKITALFGAADVDRDAGDVEGARKTLERMTSEFGNEQGLGDFIKRKQADLDLVGQEPKAFEVKDLDGKPLSPAQFKGKVVLLDFWATWCGPCVAELPNVLETYEKYHDKGFEIIGVSLDQDEKALREFIKDRGMTWRQAFDGKGWQNEVAALYEVKSIPTTYLLDADGKIFQVGLRGEALGRTVAKLLGKKAPAGKG